MVTLRLTLIALVFAVTFAAPLPSDGFSVGYPVSHERTQRVYHPTDHITAEKRERTAALLNAAAADAWKQATKVLKSQSNDRTVDHHINLKLHHEKNADAHHMRAEWKQTDWKPEGFKKAENDAQRSIEEAHASIEKAKGILVNAAESQNRRS